MKIRKLKHGPVVKGGLKPNEVSIWGIPKIKKNYYNFLIVRLIQNENLITKIVPVNKNNYYTGIIKFTNIDSVCYYQAGSISMKELINDDLDVFSLNALDIFQINTNSENLSLIFGSCRRYISICGVKLFGTGENGDKIYESIYKHQPDMFLSIGDQVYFDPIGINRVKTLKKMRKLYTKVRGFKNIKKLMANTMTYEICDDHDYHRNDTNWFLQQKESVIVGKCRKAYYEFQHFDQITNHLWYSFDKLVQDRVVSFFVMDTRGERDESLIGSDIKKIIGLEQFSNLELWLNKTHDVKFLVSPTPIVSQMSMDSWFGYPEQQKRLLLSLQNIPNIFLLVGDAHCARIAKYNIMCDNPFTVTEILSSGLVAVNHDIGSDYGLLEEKTFNKINNDFPLVLDNSANNGLLIKTILSTQSYPYPNKPSGLQKIANIYKRVVDNVFVKIIYEISYMLVQIYNQNNTLLHEEKIILEV